MRFAYVILDDVTTMVAKAPADSQWRDLDIAHNLNDVLLADWREIEASYERGQTIADERIRFLAPVARPGKILAIGLNYMDHCREQGKQPPAKPLIFAKVPSSLTGPD